MSPALTLAPDLDAEALKHCLLCGRPPRVFSLYTAPGRSRTAIYGLCFRCFELPNVFELVERHIRAGGN